MLIDVGGYIVNKSELIDAIAEKSGLAKSDAGRALEATLEVITNSLSSGDPVVMVGFGTFSVADRAARTGRNPKTGEPLDIPAATLAKFKPGKLLKDAVNNKAVTAA